MGWPPPGVDLLDGYLNGMSNILLAFGGLSLAPCLVSDMLHPQNAKKVLTKAIGLLSMIYIVMGAAGYWGFGNEIYRSVGFTLWRKKHLKGNLRMWQAHTIIDLFAIVSSPARFFIYFWVLVREIDWCFAL